MAKQIVHGEDSRQAILRAVNMASIAGLMLTTEALIAEIPGHETPAAGGGAPMY